MKKNKQHIVLFFLIFFISLKLVGLHSLDHFEETGHVNDCDVCEYVLTSNEVPFLPEEPTIVELVIAHNYYKKEFTSYSYMYTQHYIYSSFFGRPPPSV